MEASQITFLNHLLDLTSSTFMACSKGNSRNYANQIVGQKSERVFSLYSSMTLKLLDLDRLCECMSDQSYFSTRDEILDEWDIQGLGILSNYFKKNKDVIFQTKMTVAARTRAGISSKFVVTKKLHR